MRLERMMIQVPKEMKDKLNGLRREGFTISGFVRAVLEKEFNQMKKKGA
jgi:predicted DNA-binding protein